MYNGRDGWLISSRACSNLPAEARSAGHSTFQASCRLSSFYLSVFLLFWLLITEDKTVLNLTITNGAKLARVQSPRMPACFRGLYRDVWCAHPSTTHFNWIFELISSLRSNYALYSDTMPLTFLCFPNIRKLKALCHYINLCNLYLFTDLISKKILLSALLPLHLVNKITVYRTEPELSRAHTLHTVHPDCYVHVCVDDLYINIFIGVVVCMSRKFITCSWSVWPIKSTVFVTLIKALQNYLKPCSFSAIWTVLLIMSYSNAYTMI